MIGTDPCCSIVMPARDSASTVKEAIAAIERQTFYGWEILAVDDASSDFTRSLLGSFAAEDDRIKLIAFERRQGPAIARNKGIEAARGRYIAFCDSDDVWHPQKLEKQLAFMQQHRCAVSFTAYRKVSEADTARASADRIVHPPARVDYQALLRSNPIGLSTAMYDTRLCGKVYMPDIARRQDYGLWLRIMREGHIALGLDEPLVDYCIRKGSLSSNKALAAWYYWRVLRQVAELPVPRASLAFMSYVRESLRKARI